MAKTAARKLIDSHLVEGDPTPGKEIALRIDQTLTQDATGTLVMLELEAMDLERAQTEVSVQYVDHNLIQEDHKNPDDHLFLLSAAQRFGLWYSPAGNGVSHPIHQERFGKPGATLLGADSHTCAAGAIGILAMGAGGIEVAMAIAGSPFNVRMPEILGVKLTGSLPDWVSAKDVVLEMLRRHGVKGGLNKIIEYYGPGLDCLSAMDRHVIANMGTELGATATVFPSDAETKHFLEAQGRGDDWQELKADDGAEYDLHDEIDLSSLEPLIAMPTSPGNVRPVREVAGEKIYQSYIGSSANPGYRDFAVVAEIVKGRKVPGHISLDVNPTSRQILSMLARDGHLASLISAGARIHQAGCNGCIGMGQAPATHTISLRTVPRNFPGRSGTLEDKVCLVSPETAAVSALKGVITDPRNFAKEMKYPRIHEPEAGDSATEKMLVPPLPLEEARRVELQKGPNIAALPDLKPLPDRLAVKVILKVGDNVSTDEIMPAGSRILPFRSNIPEISEFVYEAVDKNYVQRAKDTRENGGHAIVGGDNYGQGSSREHAALAPRYLGLRVVIAKSFARIHWQNLVSFGVLPLLFVNIEDYDKLDNGATIIIEDVRGTVQKSNKIRAQVDGKEMVLKNDLSKRQIDILLMGGLINWAKERLVGSGR